MIWIVLRNIDFQNKRIEKSLIIIVAHKKSQALKKIHGQFGFLIEA